MKKFILTVVIILAVLCAAFVVLYVLAFYGNPVSRGLAKKTATAYLEESYSDTDYVLEGVHYNFKTGDYFGVVSSPSSPDSSFSVTVSPLGKLLYDDYSVRVVGRQNTADRIYKVYNEALEAALFGEQFPYTVHILHGNIIYKDSFEIGSFVPDGAVEMNSLILDGKYDIDEVSAIAAEAGRITVYVYDEDVSVEKMAEILLLIRDVLDSNGIGFFCVDAVLEHPGDAGETRVGRVEVMDFKYSEIYAEGLALRVDEYNRAAEEYYKEQDEIKLSSGQSAE